jgi:hypothetical protein
MTTHPTNVTTSPPTDGQHELAPLFKAPYAALYGLPTLDQVAPRVETSGRFQMGAAPTLTPLTPQATTKLGKRRAGALPVEREPKRTPLDVFGDGTLRTRDHFGHVEAMLKAHMTPKLFKDLKVVDALDELAGTVAKDVKRQIDITWKNGVAHGEWLKEAEASHNAHAASCLATMKTELFKLQVNNQSLVNRLALAKIRIRELEESQISTPYIPEPPPTAPIQPIHTLNDGKFEDINLDDLQAHLDELLGDDNLFADSINGSPVVSGPSTPDSTLDALQLNSILNHMTESFA